MPLNCSNNGTICMKFISESTYTSNTVSGFIIGSIACLITIIMIVLFMYIFFCKRRIRNKPQIPFRSHNQEQSINVNYSQEQPELNSRRSSNEQPPSYQEANTNSNVILYKHT